MTDVTTRAPTERQDPLLYQGHPISFIMLDGAPWFALADICTALGQNERAASIINRRDFPTYAKQSVEELTDEGWKPTTVLSPIGVWLFGHYVDPGRSQGLAAWARREASRLCPIARPGDTALHLSLMPDGTLPPKPYKFSGRRSEWFDLKDLGTYVTPFTALHRETSARDDAIFEALATASKVERSAAGGGR